MKIQNIVIPLSILFFVIALASCAQSTKIVTPSTTAAPTLQAASTVSLPATTATPIISPTLTMVSTLPEEDARKRLLDLLSNNGDCQLPCLWGITPGVSTYRDAQTVLMPLSALSEWTSFITEGGVVSLVYIEGDLRLGTLVDFNVDSSNNQLVSRLGLSVQAAKSMEDGSLTIFDSDFFKEHLRYYMLQNILSEYGAPTMVMVSTMAKLPSSGVPGGFKILLLYPDQGILINYTMQMQIAGENIRGCPSNAHVEFELYSPGQADSFFELLEPSGWTQLIQKTYKPIEDVSSLSHDDFVKIFSQQTDECLLTPAHLWPVPD